MRNFNYSLNQLSIGAIRELLKAISRDMADLYAKIKAGTSDTAYSNHTHRLAELSERNYGNLTGRPADDNFAQLRRAGDVTDKDRLPIWQAGPNEYRYVLANLIVPPQPSATVVEETAFGQSSAAGSSAQYSRGDHTHGTPSIGTAEGVIGGDVAMTNANQYYDGPSVSLAAGTWFIAGTVTVGSASGSAQRVTAKLWNGTTVESSSEAESAAVAVTVITVSITLAGLVTVAGPGAETWKISCASTAAAGAIKAAVVDNGAGNNASSIRAIRIGV